MVVLPSLPLYKNIVTQEVMAKVVLDHDNVNGKKNLSAEFNLKKGEKGQLSFSNPMKAI